MTTIKDIRLGNLIELVEEAGGPTAFGIKVARSGDQISALCKGHRNIGNSLARSFEEALGKPRGWFDQPQFGQDVKDDEGLSSPRPILTWENPSDLPPNTYMIIPRYDIWFAGGDGNIVYDEPSERLGDAFRAGFAADSGWSPRTHFSMRVKGDSMIEAGILDGWSVVVDTTETSDIEPDEVYAIEYEHDKRKVVKYLERLPDGGLKIISANSRHPRYRDPIVLTPEQAEHVRVIGRVVFSQGKIGRGS